LTHRQPLAAHQAAIFASSSCQMEHAKPTRSAPRRRLKKVRQAGCAAPSDLCLIACHTWDILGAAAAGWNTAFIARPGNAALAVGGQPLIAGADLDIVAQKLIKRFAA